MNPVTSPYRARGSAAARARQAAGRYLDPRVWVHLAKVINFYAYAHVEQRARLSAGPGLRLSPSVSLRNGERISLGAGVHIGERSCLWAGDRHGRIVLGDKVLLGPEVYITASNYGTVWGEPVMDQQSVEADVRIGDGAWLGVRVTVLPGVSIGDGAVVGAGAVVTADVPAGAIAVGVPARVVGWRAGYPGPDPEGAAPAGAGT